jgi:non-ribosomal peptide synthetase component F
VLPLLSAGERDQLLVQWNATQAPYPRERCVHELFAEQAARTPEAVALVYVEQTLSYGELERRANQLGQYLKTLGVGPDVIVGVCLERSLELVIGVLGVLKAGGAYLPLEPQYPAPRLAYMLQDAQAPVVLTRSGWLTQLPETLATCVCLDRDAERIATQPHSAPRSDLTPEHLAYVIYTSGSTGQPKGVLVEHAGLTNYLQYAREAYQTGAEIRAAVNTSLTFDATVTSLWVALIQGGAVILLPAGPAELPG